MKHQKTLDLIENALEALVVASVVLPFVGLLIGVIYINL